MVSSYILRVVLFALRISGVHNSFGSVFTQGASSFRSNVKRALAPPVDRTTQAPSESLVKVGQGAVRSSLWLSNFRVKVPPTSTAQPSPVRTTFTHFFKRSAPQNNFCCSEYECRYTAPSTPRRVPLQRILGHVLPEQDRCV